MRATHIWNGRQIDVAAFYSPKYLFLAGETSLRVDGKEIGRAGGFSLTESAIGQVESEGGARHTIEAQLSVSLVNPFSAPYVLRVDGVPIAQGHVAFDNLLLCLLAITVVLAAVGLAVLALLR